ncbi:MAG: ABC transporter substrate-binding protein, partial [Rudaea sp.]
MSTKKFLVFAAVLTVLTVLVGCGTATPAAQQPVTVKETVIVQGTPQVVEKVVTATPAPVAVQKTLRINLGTWPDIIDPQKSSFVNEIAHLKLIYEGLTKFNAKLETVPGAAEKWEYSADAKTLTFHVRQGLKYSDGSLLNAARFAYSIKRNINPKTAGEFAAITDEINGAPEWRGADLAKT